MTGAGEPIAEQQVIHAWCCDAHLGKGAAGNLDECHP